MRIPSPLAEGRELKFMAGKIAQNAESPLAEGRELKLYQCGYRVAVESSPLAEGRELK